MFHGKIYYFLSFLLFGITLVIKLSNFDFECHGSTLLFSDKKCMASDLNMSHEFYFVISFVWVHFSHKTDKF